jgi:hypothetical protein
MLGFREEAFPFSVIGCPQQIQTRIRIRLLLRKINETSSAYEKA